MAGCRPFTPDEVKATLRAFSGRHAPRNRCLFVLGILTGFRIREALSLRVRDVVSHNRVRRVIEVARRNMKGKNRGRAVYLPEEAQRAVLEQIRFLQWPGRDVFLFRAQGPKNRPISYSQARRLLLAAISAAGVPEDKVCTHSMRKTFANDLYDLMLDRVANGEPVDPFTEVSLALDHGDPKSTRNYLIFRDEHRRAGIAEMGKRLHA